MSASPVIVAADRLGAKIARNTPDNPGKTIRSADPGTAELLTLILLLPGTIVGLLVGMVVVVVGHQRQGNA